MLPAVPDRRHAQGRRPGRRVRAAGRRRPRRDGRRPGRGSRSTSSSSAPAPARAIGLRRHATPLGPAATADDRLELAHHRAVAARRPARRLRRRRRGRAPGRGPRGRGRPAHPPRRDGGARHDAPAAPPTGWPGCCPRAVPARPAGLGVAEAAGDLGVTERQLREDLELLWVCGLPGYGPGDLIDMAFDGDRVRVTYNAGIDRPLRLTTDEALALVVALRTLSEMPGLAEREAVSRALAKMSAAAGHAGERGRAGRGERRRPRGGARRRPRGAGAQAGAAPALLRAQPGRAHRADRRPDAAAPGRRPLLPGGVVPPGRGGAAVPARPDRRRRGARRAGRPAAAGARARRRHGVYQPEPTVAGRSGCGWPAPPAGSPTTTRSSRSPPVDDPPGGLAVTCAPRTSPGPAGWSPRSAAGRCVDEPAELAAQVAADARAALARYGVARGSGTAAG